jgi:hypothetical protein
VPTTARQECVIQDFAERQTGLRQKGQLIMCCPCTIWCTDTAGACNRLQRRTNWAILLYLVHQYFHRILSADCWVIVPLYARVCEQCWEVKGLGEKQETLRDFAAPRLRRRLCNLHPNPAHLQLARTALLWNIGAARAARYNSFAIFAELPGVGGAPEGASG